MQYSDVKMTLITNLQTLMSQRGHTKPFYLCNYCFSITNVLIFVERKFIEFILPLLVFFKVFINSNNNPIHG